jgi:acetate kinase
MELAGVMRALIVNSGSSSLKLSVIGPQDATEASVTLAGGDHGGLRSFVADHGPLDAAGHRVVHGGTDFSDPVLLDPEVTARLAELVPLAPLHQRAALDAIRAVGAALPGVPAVACFDTAFHSTMPAAASTYAVPLEWRQQWSVKRYGFHGLSHAWASRRALELTQRRVAGSRVVTCHLGSGSSLCAVLNGRSVDTTMGFTPLEGVVMSTRSGTIDPGLVLWLITQAGLSAETVNQALEHGSGLAALSGTGGDVRDIAAAAAAGSAPAALALDVWAHRLRQAIAAMTASLGGLDVLVFTGGIGEHATTLRATVADGLSFLGIAIDPDANGAATTDADISGRATVQTVVVTAREDLEVARHVRELLSHPK